MYKRQHMGWSARISGIFPTVQIFLNLVFDHHHYHCSSHIHFSCYLLTWKDITLYLITLLLSSIYFSSERELYFQLLDIVVYTVASLAIIPPSTCCVLVLLSLFAASVPVPCPGAVSYTHLDVYKRQIEGRVR